MESSSSAVVRVNVTTLFCCEVSKKVLQSTKLLPAFHRHEGAKIVTASSFCVHLRLNTLISKSRI